MGASAHDAYLESRVLAADQMELVRILYGVAIENLRQARQSLEEGDIPRRAKAISVASQALTELSSSLNHEAGGDLSRRLAQLYDYMQWRLVEANLQRDVARIDEVLGLLNTLAEGWQAAQQARAPEAADGRWIGEVSSEPDYEYAGQSWNG